MQLAQLIKQQQKLSGRSPAKYIGMGSDTVEELRETHARLICTLMVLLLMRAVFFTKCIRMGHTHTRWLVDDGRRYGTDNGADKQLHAFLVVDEWRASNFANDGMAMDSFSRFQTDHCC